MGPEIKRVRKQAAKWLRSEHVISKSERESLFEKLPRDFWHRHCDTKSVKNKSALQNYSEAKKIMLAFDENADDHNERINADLIRRGRQQIEDLKRHYDELFTGCEEISYEQVHALKKKFPYRTWIAARTSRYLTDEEAAFFGSFFDQIGSLEADARKRNEEYIKPRRRFIEKIRKGGKAYDLYCWRCPRLVRAGDLMLDGLTVTTFDKLVICPDCHESLLLLLDHLIGEERFVCPQCNRIVEKTIQKHSQPAWYCGKCYEARPLDEQGKPIVERDWNCWFSARDRREVQFDQPIKELAREFAAYIKQIPEERKIRKRLFLESKAEQMRFVEGVVKPGVSETERRFLENVLRNTMAVQRNRWHWEHQKVLSDEYIVDFYCEVQLTDLEPARLIIELDGPEHNRDPKLFTDQLREAHLFDEGYRVLRIWNARADRPYEGEAVNGTELDALIRIVEDWFQAQLPSAAA